MVDRLQQTLDPSLLSFALAKESPRSISVIAEIAPTLVKAAKRSLRDGFAFMLPGRSKAEPKRESSSQSASAADVRRKTGSRKTPMDDLEKEIKRLKLAQEPVRLDSAEAFVLEVTPEQLQKLARSEFVGRVRPNREHHVSAMS